MNFKNKKRYLHTPKRWLIKTYVITRKSKANVGETINVLLPAILTFLDKKSPELFAYQKLAMPFFNNIH